MSNSATAVMNRCLRFAQTCMPTQCVLCGASAPHGRLCRPCAGSLPRLPEASCGVCALPLPTGGTCGECLKRTPSFDSVTAAHAYAFPIDALIQAFKYRGHLSLAPLLAALLTREIAVGVDAVIPMPLAAPRLRERGFNQAHELARHIAKALALPMLGHACRKVANTPPQAALPWTERARNVRGAFVCDVELTGKHVAIVDDVMTTGATLNELARNVKRAGAARVSGWVLARTLR